MNISTRLVHFWLKHVYSSISEITQHVLKVQELLLK